MAYCACPVDLRGLWAICIANSMPVGVFGSVTGFGVERVLISLYGLYLTS